VRVDSIVGKGTTVTCDFPIDQAAHRKPRGMSEPTTFALALANETATAHLMADLALLIGPGDVITLSGDLGAGETAAARAMIRPTSPATTRLEVPSPTFTLAQVYDLPSFPLLHADLYRINDASELEEDRSVALAEGLVALIEWPERAPRRASERQNRYCAEPSARAGIDRARRRDHGLWQGGSASHAAEGAAAVSRPRRLRRRQTQAHGRRRLDPVLCAADPRRWRRHFDELAATPRRPGGL